MGISDSPSDRHDESPALPIVKVYGSVTVSGIPNEFSQFFIIITS